MASQVFIIKVYTLFFLFEKSRLLSMPLTERLYLCEELFLFLAVVSMVNVLHLTFRAICIALLPFTIYGTQYTINFITNCNANFKPSWFYNFQELNESNFQIQ